MTSILAGPILRSGPHCFAVLALCAIAMVGCSREVAREPAPRRRAILLSLDAFSERNMRRADTLSTPTFRRLFREGACAVSARPAFPAVTAPSHAALWTGTTALGNGIVGSMQLADRRSLPLDSLVNGFGYQSLDAEPVWIAALRQQRRAVALHPTHAPFAPGYPLRGQTPDGDVLRAEATRALASQGAAVLNGYNAVISEAKVLTASTLTLSEAMAHRWRNVPAGHAVAGTFAVGTSSIHVLVALGRGPPRVFASHVPDVAAAVALPIAPPDSSPARQRQLARHFSAPIALEVGRDRASVRLRLFAMDTNATEFELFVPEVRRVDANTSAVQREFVTAAGGWVGNLPIPLWRRGDFGVPLAGGKLGPAEWRLLEAAELLVDSWQRGFAWGWARHPDLLIDYLPLLDDTDHAFLAMIPETRGEVATGAELLRDRLWALADRWLASHLDVAAMDSTVLVVVSGDHGMRVTSREFHVNEVLARAGLLQWLPNGDIDVARSLALSPTGYWVLANERAAPVGSRVSRTNILDSVERVLRAARDGDGRPIVTQTWRADRPGADSLGIGGPHGGDVYYDLAPRTFWSAERSASIVRDVAPAANHGFPAVAPDMHTVLCGMAAGLPAARHGVGRVIDAAPTVTSWLGIDPPRHATGRSMVESWQRQSAR